MPVTARPVTRWLLKPSTRVFITTSSSSTATFHIAKLASRALVPMSTYSAGVTARVPAATSVLSAMNALVAALYSANDAGRRSCSDLLTPPKFGSSLTAVCTSAPMRS